MKVEDERWKDKVSLKMKLALIFIEFVSILQTGNNALLI